MEYFQVLLPLLSTFITVSLAVFLCVRHLNQKSRFILRLSLCLAALLAVTAAFGVLAYFLPSAAFDYVQSGHYAVVCGMVILSAYICFSSSFGELLFFGSIGLFFRLIGVKSAETILLFLTTNGFSNDKIIAQIILFIITGIAYLIAWFTLLRNLKDTEKQVEKIFWYILFLKNLGNMKNMILMDFLRSIY